MSLLHGRPACSRRHNGPPTKGARPLSLEIRPSYDRKLVAQSVHDTCFQRQGYYAQQFPEFPWQNGRTHRDSRDFARRQGGVQRSRATYFSPMFTHQLLKRSDANGYTVDRLVNGWAHGDLTIIKPYCKPGSLEQCCAFWTAKNFLAFAQAACFALDPTLTPESPYSKKYY